MQGAVEVAGNNGVTRPSELPRTASGDMADKSDSRVVTRATVLT